MMKKKKPLIIGSILLVIAICFLGYALNHPEVSFPWDNKVTFILYGCYIWLLFRFFVDGLIVRKNKNTTSKVNLIEAGIFFFVAILSLFIEIMETDADIYTVLRGFCVLGGLDMGIEKLVMGVRKNDSINETIAKDSELIEFEKEFCTEGKEVLVLTERGTSAARIGQRKMWNASVTVLAMVDVKTNQLVQQKKSLTWLMTEEQRQTKEKIFQIEGEKIYRLKVQESLACKHDFGRQSVEVEQGKRLFVREVLERDCREERLEAILADYLKPVKLQPQGCEELLLDKSLGMFCGNGMWNDCKCLVHLDVDKDGAEKAEDAMKTWSKLSTDSVKWDNEARAYAAKELVGTANDWLCDSVEDDEEVEKITPEAFAERLRLSEVCISTDGDFEIYYDDDDMFWGHVVIVSGNIEKGIDDATMAG